MKKHSQQVINIMVYAKPDTCDSVSALHHLFESLSNTMTHTVVLILFYWNECVNKKEINTFYLSCICVDDDTRKIFYYIALDESSL